MEFLGFALDWEAGNLYWITECSRNISIATYSGEYKRIIVSMANARDLACDPYQRYIRNSMIYSMKNILLLR